MVEVVYKELNVPMIRTGLSTAEMIKYASNALLATKISYSNEVGNICKRLGIDVYEVMRGVGLDHRISPSFLDAGLGFGGSCLSKDIRTMIDLAEELTEDPLLLKAVMAVNERQPLRLVELLHEKIGDLRGKRIAILGLAFKKGTDDVRESRAIPIIEEIQKRGALIRAYDPAANHSMRKILPDIVYCKDVNDALREADACLILTDWPEFGKLNEEFSLMRSRVIIEGRRILTYRKKEGICW